MKSKILTAAFLAFMPVTAFAACQGHDYDQASSCVDGYTWDDTTKACVKIVNS